MFIFGRTIPLTWYTIVFYYERSTHSTACVLKNPPTDLSVNHINLM